MLHVVRLGQGPPTGHCNICGEDLYGGVRSGQAHITRCARENIDAIRASTPQPLFDDSTVDTEVEAHYRKVGERMIREGRLEMHKSERAG